MPATRARFADPTRCPDCRFLLPGQLERCPECGLPLHTPLARQLLGTLQSADLLLAQLRASAPPEPAAPVAPAYPAYPAPQPSPPTTEHGIRTVSVPKILLGLGATCLLVAAVIFLAVAWSWLGVGGRTTVLIGLTAATGAAGSWLGRRGLTVAAEALTTVALGLLVLDVVGADNAGWIGSLDVLDLMCVVGAVLTAVSLLLVLPRRRLVVPQLTAPFGLLILMAGIGGQTDHTQPVAAVAVLAFAALVSVGRVRGAAVLPWPAGIGGAGAWMVLGLIALTDAVEHPSVRELWLERHGWGLVAGAALVLLPMALDRSAMVRQGCVAFAASTLTFVVALPGLDHGATRATLVAVVASLVWAGVAAVAPPQWHAAPRVPLLGSAVVPVVVVTAMVGEAAFSLATVGAPFSQPWSVRLDPLPAIADRAVLPVSVLALLLAVVLAVPRTRTRSFARVAGATLWVTGIATTALYPVPLWTVLLLLCGAAVALVGDALRRTDETGTAEGAAGAVLFALALVALPSEHLTSAVCALIVLTAAAVLWRGRFPAAQEAAGFALPAAIAGLLWSAGEVMGADPALRAAPILIVLGLLAIALPRLEVEISAAAAGMLAAAAAIPLADDVSVSLAVHLTLAGVLVTASALINADRRWFGWPGGFLLASATWVRLWDVGVEAPEAYTLPSAVALVAVGLRRLHAVPSTSTMAALGPGLVLGTVPSLLWVLDDPVTLRAGLLGTSCLALVLGGVSLRWSAPVVVGAVVGGLVVLREAAPYVAQTPQWVVIGLAGAVLIGVGVTWEARVRDLQQAAAYLGRLR